MGSVCSHPGGIVRTILHYLSSAMWRLDSPLRSHRSCWSQYQHAYSGLNKTVGPNLLQHGAARGGHKTVVEMLMWDRKFRDEMAAYRAKEEKSKSCSLEMGDTGLEPVTSRV